MLISTHKHPQVVLKQTESVDNIATGKLALEYRLAHNVDQIQVAKKMGVSATSISLRETGRYSWNQAKLDDYCNVVDKFYAKQLARAERFAV